MSRESRIIAMTPNFATTVKQLEAFGWELFSVADRWIVLSRETQNPVYDQLVAYEKNCEKKLAELLSLRAPIAPKPLNKILCGVLFCLAIVPGVLYLSKKNEQKKAFEAALAAHNQRAHELSADIQHISNTSRALFFAKHS